MSWFEVKCYIFMSSCCPFCVVAGKGLMNNNHIAQSPGTVHAGLLSLLTETLKCNWAIVNIIRHTCDSPAMTNQNVCCCKKPIEWIRKWSHKNLKKVCNPEGRSERVENEHTCGCAVCYEPSFRWLYAWEVWERKEWDLYQRALQAPCITHNPSL